MQVTFASTNQNKYNEVKSILAPHNISVGFLQAGLVEIQSDSLEEITREKAKSAYEKAGRPVIVEDDGLFIDALGGLSGPVLLLCFQDNRQCRDTKAARRQGPRGAFPLDNSLHRRQERRIV